MKKPTLSEIRARYEYLLDPMGDADTSYLLDLVSRMGSTLEHAIECGYFPFMLAKEARELLKEIEL